VQLTIELAKHFEEILKNNKRINGGYLVFFEYQVADKVKLAIEATALTFNLNHCSEYWH